MKTAVQVLFEEMNRIRLEDECENIGAIEFFKLQNEAFEKTLQIEKEQLKNAFCAGWDKSKTALMPNKKNHYSIEYLNKIQNESKSNIR
jgi:hypothetical protein